MGWLDAEKERCVAGEGSGAGAPLADEADRRAFALLQAASGRRLLAMHAIIVVALLATGQVYDGSIHALSHWVVLGAYAACSIGLALAESWTGDVDESDGSHAVNGRSEWLAWASTGLNAAVAVYVEIEHMLAGAATGFDDAASAVSRLPAFLLLLQTALTMRVWHTIVFSSVVTLAWGTAIVLVHLRSSAMVLGPHVSLGDEVPSLLTFIAASLVVIDGIRRLRMAVTTALRLAHERSLLARFVPGSVAVRLAREGGLGTVRERHACLLTLDIRGFSALTRERGQDEMVRTLLDMRALAHTAVTAHGGLVDKYVGDGMLAQFMAGRPEAQARDALAASRDILHRLEILNAKREADGTPPLRVALALHAGTVLAGVFDDGKRAEFTVIGPAMNALARLETRTKEAGLALGASEAFVGLLPWRAAGTAAPIADGGEPVLFALGETAATEAAAQESLRAS